MWNTRNRLNGNCLSFVFVAIWVAVSFFLIGCSGKSPSITIEAPTLAAAPAGGSTAPPPTSTSPCASYLDGTDTRITGTESNGNCIYGTDFVSENKPLTTDVTIKDFSGVHIFQATLQVGIDRTSGEIPEGPTLTIEAGATLAWTSAADYLLITRGSRLNALGTQAAPITLTAYEDAVSNTAAPFATQLWGGVVINGKGITNKCDDEQRSSHTCHIQSEGKPSHYGGSNNQDSSGTLRYVVIKYPGFEVAPGDELNGLTLNAVGGATVVENVQVYSAYDDGVEFFGGAVDVSNFIALYVRDDSIDYADGWVGSISNALVIHAEGDGNRCIEGDNQGSSHGARPLTNPRVSNLTCITSGGSGGTHGDSEGILLRRGVSSQLANSIVYDGYGRNMLNTNGNECLELDDSATRANAQTGAMTIKSTAIVCREATKDSLPNGDSIAQWVLNNGSGSYPNNTDNLIWTMSDDADLAVVGGSKGYFTLPSFTDVNGVSVTVPSTNGVPIGAVSESNDWTADWTVCLEPRAENVCGLWFL